MLEFMDAHAVRLARDVGGADLPAGGGTGVTETGFYGVLPVRTGPAMQMMASADGKTNGWGLFCPGVAGMARARIRHQLGIGVDDARRQRHRLRAGVQAQELVVRAAAPRGADGRAQGALEGAQAGYNAANSQAQSSYNAAAANAHLNKDGIIPRAVANYGLPDFIRFTIGTEEEMRAVVASLAAFMKA